MKQSILRVFLFMIIPVFANAQPYVDIVNLQGTYFLKTDYKKVSTLQNNTWQGSANIFLPVTLKNKNIFFSGLSYESMQFNVTDKTTDHTSTNQLSSVTAQIGYIHQLNNPHWKVMVLAVPRLASDFEKVSGKHYQMGGAVLFTYKVKNSLKLKIGGYYNREFFGNYFMGLAGIDWKVSNHTYIFGVLPGSLNMEYRISPQIYTGLAYKCITASYRLSDNNDSYYVREGDTFWGDSRLSNFYHLYLTPNLVLSADIGYTGFRYFEQYNKKDKVEITNTYYQKIKDNWFFSLGLSFRVRMDKDYQN